MPYHLKEASNGLYYVEAPGGRKMSKHPIPKESAEAQMRALYAHLNQDKVMYEMSKKHYEHMKKLEKMSK